MAQRELLERAEKARWAGDTKTAYAACMQVDEAMLSDDEKQALWLELSISAYYQDDRARGLLALNKLLLHPRSKHKELSIKNGAHYYKAISHYAPSFTFHTLYTPDGVEHPTNPSIVAVPGGYLATVRSVNYTIDAKTGRYNWNVPNLVSKIYLQRLDASMAKVGETEIVATRVVSQKAFARGIEDVRLFIMDDTLWMTCTLPDSNAWNKTRVGLIDVGPVREVMDMVVVRGGQLVARRCFTLAGPHQNKHEKNWVPIVRNETLHMIYSFSPLVLLTPDLSVSDSDVDPGSSFKHEKPCREMLRKAMPLDMSTFRGSSCGIPWGTGSLLIVHEALQCRKYTHRFLVMDGDDVLAVSVPFFFTHYGVEFCVGMAYASDGAHILVTFGVNDGEAKMISVSVSDVERFLQDHALLLGAAGQQWE